MGLLSRARSILGTKSHSSSNAQLSNVSTNGKVSSPSPRLELSFTDSTANVPLKIEEKVTPPQPSNAQFANTSLINASENGKISPWIESQLSRYRFT